MTSVKTASDATPGHAAAHTQLYVRRIERVTEGKQALPNAEEAIMKVEQLMEKDVITCQPNDNLESVAMLMWNNDCGAIPIVSMDGRPVGVLTDRDIAIASALQHKPLWDIKTLEVSRDRPVHTCGRDEDATKALKIMRENRIRRLMVVDGGGQIEGILSIDDVVHFASQGYGDSSLNYENVMSTLKAICTHH